MDARESRAQVGSQLDGTGGQRVSHPSKHSTHTPDESEHWPMFQKGGCTYGNSITIFLSDAFCFRFALLCGTLDHTKSAEAKWCEVERMRARRDSGVIHQSINRQYSLVHSSEGVPVPCVGWSTGPTYQMGVRP